MYDEVWQFPGREPGGRLGGISTDTREFAGGIPLVECTCGDNEEG